MKKGCAFLSLSLLVSLATACSSSGGTAAKSSPAATKNLANESAELTFYVTINDWTPDKFMEAYGNQIQKHFPNYKLNFVPQVRSQNSLGTAASTGQTIDIIISSIGLTAQSLTKFNYQSDISDLIKKNKYDLSRLEPSTVKIQNQLANGGIYGLPVSTTSAALFYNKDIFDKFGVAYPTQQMTWNQTYELAKKMTRTEGNVKYKGMYMSVSHLMALDQRSSNLVDPKTLKGNLTDPELVRSFTNLQRFYAIPGNELNKPHYTLGQQTDAFIKDKNVAMFAGLGTSGENMDGVNWDVAPLPFYDDKPGVGPQSYPTYFYITSACKNRDAAFQVLNYVTSDEYQDFMVKQGSISILKNGASFMKDFGQAIEAYKGKNLKALLPDKYADPSVETEYQDIAMADLLKAIEDVNAGTDVNTALRNANEKLDGEIAKAKQ